MALAAVQTAMHLEAKSLHPFFAKAPRESASEELQPTNATTTLTDAQDDAEYGAASPQSAKTRKKRTRKTGTSKDKIPSESAAKGQTSLEIFARPPKHQDTLKDASSNSDAVLEFSLEEDPNHERRKRQKTVSPPPSVEPPASAQSEPERLDWHRQLQVEVAHPQPEVMQEMRMDNAVDLEPAMDAQESMSLLRAVDLAGAPQVASNPLDDTAHEMQKATPKKHIKVTKTGKLVSSPPKPLHESPKKRRGRPRAKAKIPPTVTVIKYGSASDIESKTAVGQKIEDILNGPRRPGRRATKIKLAPAKATGPPKSPHPFFTGKKDEPQAKSAVQKIPPTPRKSACTPGKLRTETRRDRTPEDLPAFGVNARSGRGNKQSGLYEASWPTSETTHVRNMAGFPSMQLRHDGGVQLALRPRKMKNAVTQLSAEEELVSRLARNLSENAQDASERHLSTFESPADVRLPTRLLTTSTEISRRVREQVLTRLGDHVTQELQPGSHLAVARLFFDIRETLTPFDEGKCESHTWNQKYSPQSTEHVLYNFEEAVVLKNWLESLTVMAVGGALKTAALFDAKQPPRKKRKKAVDDFIVSDDDDEEEGEMIEIPNAEVLPHMRSLRLSRWTRNKNVVLISGPNGCGKSAMVHAVAKELGFEVFEINSGMRRAGKDIQDKVGDMTANHLVNHKRNAPPVQEDVATTDDTDIEQVNSALQDEITSGRQGTMTSFFQAKPAAKPQSISKPQHQVLQPKEAKTAKVIGAQAVLPMVAAARKSQKQSLIFFEEADILFEEDQQFWAQVTKLALNSKRPIVISCNDETQIPVYDLPLAAVLRLQPAPIDLATDYLLVLAGREGHILERKAVQDLYESKNHDLRASINELDFWCQMSVGDRKGGLEWMYQRWPPGKDRDERGDILRVASEGTYQSGMGWLSHNVFESQANAVFDKEEELLQEVWADWGISPNEWTPPASNPNQPSKTQPSITPSNLAMLQRLDEFVDTLSASDSFSRIGLPTYPHHHLEPTDPTLPPIPDKTRLSYTISAPLLQADPRTDFSSLDTSLYIQSRLLLSRAYPEFSPPLSYPSSNNTATETAYADSILSSRHIPPHPHLLTRAAFASALDVLASPPDAPIPERSSYNLNLSSFDRTFSIITLDLAPYVRSIVAHERDLEAKRTKINSLLCLGGSQGEKKRGRSTRAARTAIEGGVRETKRRERWFDAPLDFGLVMGTAGSMWSGIGWRGEGGEEGGGSDLASVLDGVRSDSVGDEEGPAVVSQDVVMEDRGQYGREITLDFSK
ncbi:hypothetical protein T440DRAFT_422819 [Plenodomus tracheiphilus IPT5]|uniref:Rhodanese domain-containing protein n=1 Tax=Plenodomus tracheiphilus IPT5 TaxID=1408161 RepID=A0A6A7B866_9PLEO|nr:hypothetical protein T440DRAFT_422819 [Plenodomus tracheiphilus IPT5]